MRKHKITVQTRAGDGWETTAMLETDDFSMWNDPDGVAMIRCGPPPHVPSPILAPVGADPIKQAEVDRGLVKLLDRYVGMELTPYVRAKMEREAREYLDECRRRKLIAFNEVDVRISPHDAGVHVEYFK